MRPPTRLTITGTVSIFLFFSHSSLALTLSCVPTSESGNTVIFEINGDKKSVVFKKESVGEGDWYHHNETLQVVEFNQFKISAISLGTGIDAFVFDTYSNETKLINWSLERAILVGGAHFSIEDERKKDWRAPYYLYTCVEELGGKVPDVNDRYFEKMTCATLGYSVGSDMHANCVNRLTGQRLNRP